MDIPGLTTANADCSIDESSIRYLTELFFAKNRKLFHVQKAFEIEVAGKKLNIDLEAQASQAPMLELAPLTEAEFARWMDVHLGRIPRGRYDDVPAGPSLNVRITLDKLKLKIKVSGSEPRELDVKAVVVGLLSVENGILSIESLDGEIFAAEKQDSIATLVFLVLIDILKPLVASLPLPQPQYLGVSARLSSAVIESKEIRCRLTIGADGEKTQLALPRSAGGDSAEAHLKLQTADDAVNLLVQKFFDLPHFRESASTTYSGFGVRAEVMGGIQTPTVTFAKGIATGRTEIGFRASVGVQAFGDWLDIGVTPFNANLVLAAKVLTDSSGQKVVLNFLPNFDTLTIDFGITLPGFLGFLLHPIQALLGQLVQTILSALKTEVPGILIPVYTIAQPEPVFEVALKLGFASLGIQDSKLSAAVSVKEATAS